MTQYARPDADISTGGWSTAPLYASIDETSYSDADAISGPNKGDGTCEIRLSDAIDPQTGSSHVLRVRGYENGTPVTGINLNVKLYQGATLIKDWLPTWTGSYASYELTLSVAEADTITDYTDLRVQFVQDYIAGAQGRSYVSWFEFALPDAVLPNVTQAVGVAPAATLALSAPQINKSEAVAVAPSASVAVAATEEPTRSISDASQSVSVTDAPIVVVGIAASASQNVVSRRRRSCSLPT